MSLKYTIGDLVWATIRKQCPWPGRVSDPPTDLEPPEENSDYHCIYFFGFKYYKWVRERYLRPYEKYQEKMMRYCNVDGFMDALNHIVEYMENPEKFTQFDDVRGEVDDSEFQVNEEDDEPLDFDDDENDSDDDEPMDTSVVEQEETSVVKQKTDKNIECPKVARVLLQKHTIYECEVCAVCFLKKKDFERHKRTHVEETEDEGNSTETRQEDISLNNNSNICDKNENEKQTINFTILDNKIKLKFRNGKLIVPPMLSPVVTLDRIEAITCKQCDKFFVGQQEYRLHEMMHLNKERCKVQEDINSSDKPYRCIASDDRLVLNSAVEMLLAVQEPSKFIYRGGIKYCRFGDDKEHKKHLYNETVENREDTSEVEPIQEAEDEIDVVQQASVCNYQGDDKLVSENISHPNCATKETKVVKKIWLGMVLRSKKTLPIHDNNLLKAKEMGSGKQNITNIKPEQTFSCKICRKIFNRKGYLKKHYAVHTTKNRYPCDHCKKVFRKEYLKEHIKRHEGIRDFVCRYCPKTFYGSSAWKIHERTHTGHKPYHCDCCNKDFSDPSTYNRHIRSHTGEKRYKCDICFERFIRSTYLKRHIIMKHDKIKGIKCKKCSKIFCFPSELRRHFKDKHGNDNSA